MLKQLKKDIVILVESTNEGKPAWWYVKCKSRIAAEKLKGICRIGKDEDIQLDEYGDIITSGWGKTPPEDIRKKIDQTY